MKRPGFLTRYVPVTITDHDITIPDKELFGGDFNQDQVINQADLDLLTNYITNGATSYEDAGFDARFDLNGDLFVDGSDVTLAADNLGKTMADYYEGISN